MDRLSSEKLIEMANISITEPPRWLRTIEEKALRLASLKDPESQQAEYTRNIHKGIRRHYAELEAQG